MPRFALLVLLAAALAGCGGSAAKITTPPAPKQTFAGGQVTPPRRAPPIQLHDAAGESVTLAAQRGRYVLVTFLYTHCPDVCPLITSNLRVAQNLMSHVAASKTAMIAVSVDPRGDTRKAVAAFLARHEMTGRMQYLVGSQKELVAAWKAWGVGSERDVKQPEFVNHSGLIYGITGSGKRMTIYAANFQPSDIAHDAPLLAAR